MAIERWEKWQERQGNQLAAGIAKLLRQQFGDIPLSEIEVVPNLELIKEYKSKPHTPELITQTWQELWKIWGERVGFTIDVPLCDRNQEELAKLEQNGNMMVYVPPGLSSQENRHLLGKMFPQMSSYSVQEGNLVTNGHDQGGWFDIEASAEAPNRNTTEEQLREQFSSQGRKGQTLNTYIIGSQASRVLTGQYFDEGLYWSRLLGSRDGCRVVSASFVPGGYLYVHSHLEPGDHNPNLGGRSEGVKKA